ncbi:hypothetical protein DUNSADRAFT_4183 [Dunaliella salina]|uniref:Ubiquitin-like domain-containing protein n=1 Tax=Dunaliella salina TaxID=3046 RepID=A0ABQ7GSF2_DUNSA|nr:hypothetical protein DUNSADRAFT_4183 [Dunaliella salina]|eukprot:KAF5837547.1 hypothetical protein DUNSADRAFT_4183 [Dunaliella salina]
MAPRLRIEFAAGLLPATLHRSWFFPSEEVQSIAALTQELQRRFHLGTQRLLLVLDGFTVPSDAPLQCLRDGDVLLVAPEQDMSSLGGSKAQQGAVTSLLDLPNDLIMIILCEASCYRTLRAASCCCKRLHSLKQQLASQACYAQGVALHRDTSKLKTAITDAAEEAMSRMRGSVTFGIVLVQGHDQGYTTSAMPGPSRGRGRGRPTRHLPPMHCKNYLIDPAYVLQNCLRDYQGVPVIGCGGVGNIRHFSGSRMRRGMRNTWNMRLAKFRSKLAEEERRRNGVVVLLGYEPGCRAVPFVDLSDCQDPTCLEMTHRRPDIQPYTKPSVSMLSWLSTANGIKGSLAVGGANTSEWVPSEAAEAAGRAAGEAANASARGAVPWTRAAQDANAAAPLKPRSVWLLGNKPRESCAGVSGLVHWLHKHSKGTISVSGGVVSGGRLFFGPSRIHTGSFPFETATPSFVSPSCWARAWWEPLLDAHFVGLALCDAATAAGSCTGASNVSTSAGERSTSASGTGATSDGTGDVSSLQLDARANAAAGGGAAGGAASCAHHSAVPERNDAGVWAVWEPELLESEDSEGNAEDTLGDGDQGVWTQGPGELSSKSRRSWNRVGDEVRGLQFSPAAEAGGARLQAHLHAALQALPKEDNDAIEDDDDGIFGD